MRRILIFNPSTDGALSFGRQVFTPPLPIQRMERQLDVLPLWWAQEDDILLVHDTTRAERFILSLTAAGFTLPRVSVIGWDDTFRDEWTDVRVMPWGWNHTLRRRLLQWGMPLHLLPTDETIDTLRQLSGRETAARVMNNLKDSDLAEHFIGKDMTFVTSPKQAERLFAAGRPLIFKPPWSSSGKGLVIARQTPGKTQQERLLRTIQEKGGILADTFYDKVLDFALEFDTSSGSCRFLTCSVFSTDGRCRYEGNLVASEEERWRVIERHGGDKRTIMRLASRYEETFTQIFAPHYHGIIGVDMLLARTTEGVQLHPCVEINMRGNMGMLAHCIAKNHGHHLTASSPFWLTPPEPESFHAVVTDGTLTIQPPQRQANRQPTLNNTTL